MATPSFRQSGKARLDANFAQALDVTPASRPEDTGSPRTQSAPPILTDQTVEIAGLAAAPAVGDASEIAPWVQTSRMSAGLNSAPAAPTTPDLGVASDTGQFTNDNITTDTTPTFNGSGPAGLTVRIYEGATLIASGLINGGGKWSITLPAQSEGTHAYYAVSFDGVDESAPSASLNVTIDLSAPAAPTIDLDAASDSGADDADDVTSDTTPSLSGTTEAGGLVRILRDNVEIDAVTADGSGAWSWTSGVLADGDYLFTARAEDAAGNVGGDADLTVSIDTSAPAAPTIDLDADSDSGDDDADDLTNATAPSFSGTAEAGATVTILRDGVEVGTTTADGSGDWTWTSASLADGDYVFTARAEDGAGNTAETDLTVTIDTAPSDGPTLELDVGSDTGLSGSDGITGDTTPTLSGTGPANTLIRIYDDGVQIDETWTDGSGDWSITLTAQGEGSHRYEARSVDAAGNESGLLAGAEQQVNTTVAGSQYGHAVTVLADGGWVITWSDNDAAIAGQRYDADGDPVGGEFTAQTTAATNLVTPTVTALDDGGFVITWAAYQLPAGLYELRAQVFDEAGDPLGGELLIGAPDFGIDPAARIIARDGGGFIATWTSEVDGGGTCILMRLYDASGAPEGAEIRVDEGVALYVEAQQITRLEGGGFAISWQSAGVVRDAYVRAFDADGTPVGLETQLFATPGFGEGATKVTALVGGGFLATWSAYSGFDYDRVYGQVFDASGAAVGSVITVIEEPGGTEGRQVAAALPDGGFVIVWSGTHETGTHDVFMRRYDASGALVDERTVNSVTDDYQSNMQVATLADGGFVVTWESWEQDGSGVGVYGQVFGAEGWPIGGEFRVNANTDGDQTIGRPIALPDGSFLVVYMSFGQDEPGGDGVFARRFEVVAPAVADVVVDITPPDAPSAPDLDAGSDTGSADSDDVTSDDTPTLTGTGPANTLIRIYEGSTLVASGMSDGAGDWSIDLPAQTDGSHSYSARAVDAAGNESTLGGPETIVNTETADEQYAPQITTLEDGGYVIVWVSTGQDGAGAGVFGQRYDSDDTPVGSEFQINTENALDQYEPSVAALTGGGFVVTWSSWGQDGDLEGIYAQRFDADGDPDGGEIAVSSTSASYQMTPRVAALPDGGFVIVWFSDGQDGDSSGVYLQRYDSAGAPVGGEVQVNTETASAQYNPAIAVLADGGFIVTWTSEDQDGDSSGVFAQRFDAAGDPVGVEFQVNTETTSGQYTPDVTGLAGGGFVIVWHSEDQDGDSGGVFAQVYDAAGDPVGTERQVNTYAANEQNAARVTALPDGGFVVVWDSEGQDGDNNGVYAQRFDATGSPVGGEFQVNSHTPDNQGWPTVAALANGDLVFTWQSNEQDGDQWGVVSRRFAAEAPTVTIVVDTTAPADDGSGSPTLEQGDTLDLDGWLAYADANTADVRYILDSMSHGTVWLSGSELEVGDAFTQADIDAGRVTFVHDSSLDPEAGFDFTVEDDAGNATSGTFEIAIDPANTAPVLTDFEVTLTVTEGDGPTLLDADVSFTDAEGNFDGGYLEVLGGEAEDVVSIRHQGMGAGEIGYDSDTGEVFFGGVLIGYASGGSGCAPLAVDFNADATPEAIEALVENLTFEYQGDDPAASRTLFLSIVDDEGASIAGDDRGFLPYSGPHAGTVEDIPGLFISVADFDNDGDLDLGVLEEDGLMIYRNRGTDAEPDFIPAGSFGIAGYFRMPILVDVDDDGRVDLIGVAGPGNAVYQRRTASGWRQGDNELETLLARTFATTVDFDGDGDMDVIACDMDPWTYEATGGLRIIENQGGGVWAELTGADNPLSGIQGDIGIAMGDVDGDGDLDLFTSGLDGTRYYRNDNDVWIEQTGFANPLDGLPALHLALADLTGDGFADFVAGFFTDTIFGENVPTGLQTFTVNVTPVNDDPYVENNLGTMVDEGDSVAIDWTELSFLDAESDLEDVIFTVTALPSHGVLYLDGVALGAGDTFTQQHIDDGLVSYQHDGSEDGTDSFQFDVSDGVGGSNAGHSFSFAINPVDDDATAQDDEVSTTTSVVLSSSVFADNGSGPDADPDGPPLEVVAVNGEALDVGVEITLASGALLTLRADGSFDYDPNGAFPGLTAGWTGGINTRATDSFTYTLAGGASATVTVAIGGEYGGGDLILGGAGADTLLGGYGADTLYGHTGADRMNGDRGDDQILGGAGDDAISGEVGDDTLQGGTGADQLFGGAGNDTLSGGADNDVVQGGTGTDLLLGGDGDDWLNGGADNDTLDGSAGDDMLLGAGGDDILRGGVGADDLQGGAGADLLEGGGGDDRLAGGEGHDQIQGDLGADTLLGGGGDDRMLGGEGGDNLYGGDGLDTLSGGVGDDELFGEAGEDILSGDAGHDRLDGGAGRDVLNGQAGDDHLSGGEEADTLNGGSGDDTLSGGGGDDILRGADGIDILNGGRGADSLSGGSGNDTLNGEGAADVLTGGLGDDILTGGTGDDILSGGGGHDLFVFAGASGADVITDFRAGAGTEDVLRLDGAIFADFADVFAHATNTSAGVRISKDGMSITLNGVRKADLHADDFVFTPPGNPSGGSDALVLPAGLEAKGDDEALIVCPPIGDAGEVLEPGLADPGRPGQSVVEDPWAWLV